MSLRELPTRPNFEHLQKQAKDLKRDLALGDLAAFARMETAGVSPLGEPKLADAMHVIAREYGFEDWAKLKAHVGSLAENPFEALIAAIKANDAELVRKVLARSAELRAKIDEPLADFFFDAPAIVSAVSKDNRAMVEALLDAGANINARSTWWAGGFGVLDISRGAMSEFLISRGAYVDVHAAARLGMLDRVKELVEADPSLVHANGGDGQRPLHFAATVEIAEYLLSKGAEIDAIDVDHESTAAQYVVSHWPTRPDVARYLVERGAKTDILMVSALGDLERVREMVDEDPEATRISVTEKDFPKINPQTGGTIYIFGWGWGKTPHMLARECGYEDVFQLLMQRSSLAVRFTQACELGDDALAKEILVKHPDLVKKIHPLSLQRILRAAVRDNAQAVEMMVDAGWPADVGGEQNKTALHWAAFHGNLAMTQSLLEHGANVHAVENEFQGTPMDWALHGTYKSWRRDKGDYPAVVKALLAAGSKVPEAMPEEFAAEDVLEVLRAAR